MSLDINAIWRNSVTRALKFPKGMYNFMSITSADMCLVTDAAANLDYSEVYGRAQSSIASYNSKIRNAGRLLQIEPETLDAWFALPTGYNLRNVQFYIRDNQLDVTANYSHLELLNYWPMDAFALGCITRAVRRHSRLDIRLGKLVTIAVNAKVADARRHNAENLAPRHDRKDLPGIPPCTRVTEFMDKLDEYAQKCLHSSSE